MRWRQRRTPIAVQPQVQPAPAPPDPKVIRARLEAETMAAQTSAHEQWVMFIAREVLPLVNAALHSVEPVECQARTIKIYGSQLGVTIWSTEYDVNDVTWADYLRRAFRKIPAYKGYKVALVGVQQQRSDMHWVARVQLSMKNPEKSMADFRRNTRKYRVRYFEVVIGP